MKIVESGCSIIKKINYFLSCVLAILGASVFFLTFNEQYSETLTLLNINQFSSGENTNVYININPRESGNTIDYFLEVTNELFNEVKTPGFVFGSETSNEKIHNKFEIFMTNHPELLSHLYVKSELSLKKIINKSNWHITNNPKSKNDTIIDYLDHSYYEFDTGFKKEISIRPFSQLVEQYPKDAGQIIVTFVVDNNKVEGLIEKMSEVYKPFTATIPIRALIGVNDRINFQINFRNPPLLTTIFTMPYSILWLSVLCVLFISIYVSIRKTKEITISYLHGYSRKKIITKFFLPYVVSSSSLFIIIMLITSLVLTDSYGALYIEYIKVLLPFVALHISLMVVSVGLTYLWVYYRFSSEILKENKQYGIIFGLVSMLRIGVIMVLVIPLLHEWSEIKNREPYLSFYNENQHLTHGLTVGFSSVNATINNDEEKILNAFKTAVSKQELSYVDYFEYFLKSKSDTNNPFDNVYTTSNQITLPKVPYLIVNNKYMQDYANKNIETSDEIVILMPEKYKDKREHDILRAQEINKIQFYSENFIFAPHFETGPETPNSGVLENPIILVDPDPLISQYQGNVIDFSEEKILLNLTKKLEEQYPASFSYYSIQSSLNRNIIQQNQSIARFTQLVIIYIILIAVFLITSTSVYFSTFGKEIAIHYMSGYGYLKRYFRLLLTLSLVSFIAFGLVYYLLKQTMQVDVIPFITIIVLTLMFEYVITYVAVHTFERKNMPMIIKGDY